MPAVPLSESVADAVAAALTAVGLTYQSAQVAFSRHRYPKYALKDVAAPKLHVVPLWPARLEPLDDNAGTATETPVAVTLDAACEKGNDAKAAELTGLLESIAVFLAAKNVDGCGYPTEPLVIDRNEEMLDGGHFCAAVAVFYRVFRNVPSPPVDEDFP